jgi:adenylate cyclase
LQERVVQLNQRRARSSLPITQVYVALHIGEVFYGNIGSDERLDFTVVGPAVNEVARIAAMCRSVERDALLSQAFADAMGIDRARLVSVGRYALRGVEHPQELFTLDPFWIDAAAAECLADAGDCAPDSGERPDSSGRGT